MDNDELTDRQIEKDYNKNKSKLEKQNLEK